MRAKVRTFCRKIRLIRQKPFSLWDLGQIGFFSAKVSDHWSPSEISRFGGRTYKKRNGASQNEIRSLFLIQYLSFSEKFLGNRTPGWGYSGDERHGFAERWVLDGQTVAV